MSLTALAALDSQMESIDVLRNSLPPDDSTAKISAYYSLVFPNITFYLQTLTVTIGRRCIPNASTSASDNSPVDVDLGPLKSVSRLHAKIEYEEDDERFVLAVVGRNGAWVDGVWSGSGSRVPLGERSVFGLSWAGACLNVDQVSNTDSF
jgi:forkhead box protein K